jgi:hypothetical protein
MKNKPPTVPADQLTQAGEKIIAPNRKPTIQVQVSLDQLDSDSAKVSVVQLITNMEVKRTRYWCISATISAVISTPLFWYALRQII